jgi:hypothetical protein
LNDALFIRHRVACIPELLQPNDPQLNHFVHAVSLLKSRKAQEVIELNQFSDCHLHCATHSEGKNVSSSNPEVLSIVSQIAGQGNVEGAHAACRLQLPAINLLMNTTRIQYKNNAHEA